MGTTPIQFIVYVVCYTHSTIRYTGSAPVKAVKADGEEDSSWVVVDSETPEDSTVQPEPAESDDDDELPEPTEDDVGLMQAGSEDVVLPRTEENVVEAAEVLDDGTAELPESDEDDELPEPMEDDIAFS
jgi:hypothetical protein